MSSFILLFCSVFPGATIDFDTEVLPVLTKAGCNSGACHGAAAGRGGLKLSLFAGNPAADHAALVLQLEGRRVNLSHPDKSLLLLKPLGYLDHEGGVRFDVESPEASLITRWIEQGAERHQLRHLIELEVTPEKFTATESSREIQLTVSATFSDGTARDVTSSSLFVTPDPSAVEVSVTGEARVLRPGCHTVVIRYLDGLRTAEVVMPMTNLQEKKESTRDAGNFVDQFIDERLNELGLPASPRASDSELIRRVQLDLTGRLPSAVEWKRFLDSSEPEKFERLIEQLLASDEFVEYWTYRLGHWLQIPAYATRGDTQGAIVYRDWLREQIRQDVGWNAIAYELATARGDSHRYGPANFHRQVSDARGEAELVANVFLGVELRCANCHNHPLDRWTQDDYHGLAAVFARLDRAQVVSSRPRGEVTHPVTGSAATPRLPGFQNLPPDSDTQVDFARWLVGRDNTYFAQAFVNRVWRELMGRGLIEPVDAIRPTNPATHPELLARLADDFVRSGYSLKHLVRTIARSAAYQRSSQTSDSNRSDNRYYSRAIAKPLSPEVYVDAVGEVTEVRIPALLGQAAGRAIGNLLAHAQPGVRELTGCTANETCLPAESIGRDLASQLQLLNGEFLNRSLADSNSYLARAVTSGSSTAEIIDDHYVRALSRMPSEIERAFWLTKLEGAEDGRIERLQDFLWSLLNCQEFATNH